MGRAGELSRLRSLDGRGAGFSFYPGAHSQLKTLKPGSGPDLLQTLRVPPGSDRRSSTVQRPVLGLVPTSAHTLRPARPRLALSFSCLALVN